MDILRKVDEHANCICWISVVSIILFGSVLLIGAILLGIAVNVPYAPSAYFAVGLPFVIIGGVVTLIVLIFYFCLYKLVKPLFTR
uniref:Transmembrane protein n=1 Tax=Clandestinovirus TaxID=2831644 RepID=A0A8F8PMR6_9VIRU|nr:transmembrane protein [Clandestinovirus]